MQDVFEVAGSHPVFVAIAAMHGTTMDDMRKHRDETGINAVQSGRTADLHLISLSRSVARIHWQQEDMTLAVQRVIRGTRQTGWETSLIIRSADLPETVTAILPGRRLDDLIKIEGGRDLVILDARGNAASHTLTLGMREDAG